MLRCSSIRFFNASYFFKLSILWVFLTPLFLTPHSVADSSKNSVVTDSDGCVQFQWTDIHNKEMQRERDFNKHFIFVGIASRHVSDELMEWQIHQFFQVYRRLFLRLEEKNLKMMSLAVADVRKVSGIFKPIIKHFIKSAEKKSIKIVKSLLDEDQIEIPQSFTPFFRMVSDRQGLFVTELKAENPKVPHIIVLSPQGEILVHITENTPEENQKLFLAVKNYLESRSTSNALGCTILS